MKKIMEKLNKHFFPLLVAVLLLVCALPPIKASAGYRVPLNYADLDYSVKYGTTVNTVTYNIPEEEFYLYYRDYQTQKTYSFVGTDSFSVDVNDGDQFDVLFYPAGTKGFLLEDMPVGARLYIEVVLDETDLNPSGEGVSLIQSRYRYLTSDNAYVKTGRNNIEPSNISGNLYTYLLDYTIEDISGAVSFSPFLYLENYTGNFSGTLRLQVVKCYVEMDVSPEFWSQFQAQQNGKLLKDLVNGTPEQDQIANDSNNEMSAAAGKLDNLGEQLNSVDKPNVDNMDVSADNLLGGMAATTMLTAPVLEVWKNPVALSLLTVVVTIVLISWVFFGKK